MAKSKNPWLQPVSKDRYLIWAVVFTLTVGVSLVTQIRIANIQMDTETYQDINFRVQSHK